MKKLIHFSIVLLLLAQSTFSSAQSVEVEKTYELTGKSKRGALANVEYDAAKGTYTLYYVTKSTEKKAKFEIYVFDKDFNFVNMTEDEIEFEKVKTKYTWFKYKGEQYVVEGLFVEPNLTGTLVLKKKRISYSYDWLFLGYRKKVEVLEKVKPKSEDGKVYQYHTHFEDDRDGTVYILVGEKDKIGKNADYNKPFTKLHVLKFNKDIDLEGDIAIDFQYPQHIVSAKTLPHYYEDDADNASFKDFTYVFAPLGFKGFNVDPSKTAFTYVRISNDMKVVDRINFESPSPGWKIDELVYDAAKNDVYYFGPSAEGKDKYWQEAINVKKYQAVQLMKISNHKLDYITSTNLEEFEAKLMTPPGQKKSPAYQGKKFKVINYYIASNGDFIVNGQNFVPNDKTGPQYTDVLSFHFSSKGVLKAQYGIDTKETNDIAKANGAPQDLIESGSLKSMYWFVREIDGANSAGRLLTYVRACTINLENGGLSEMRSFGTVNEKPTYFLDPNFPYLETEKGGKVVFFGSDKKGKNIWFCRVKLD